MESELLFGHDIPGAQETHPPVDVVPGKNTGEDEGFQGNLDSRHFDGKSGARAEEENVCQLNVFVSH